MSNANLLYLLKKPLITEKSTTLTELSQYSFEVALKGNKIELSKAFEAAYPGRKVLSVKTILTPGKRKRVGKKTVTTRTVRKAIFKISGEPLEIFTGV